MSDRRPVLELRNVSTHYGLVSVLRDVQVEIYPGEMVCLLGGNASGKTTTLKTILGYVKPSAGEVFLDGEPVSGMPTAEIVARGISMVPENRRLFANMTVSENLDLGAYQRTDRAKIAEAGMPEKVVEQAEKWGITNISNPELQHGTYSFFFKDRDKNWWEILTNPPGGYAWMFEQGGDFQGKGHQDKSMPRHGVVTPAPKIG